MRQIILTSILFLALVLPCQSQMLQSVVTGKASAVTDYTADANCMGAWFMNGGLSAGTDNETDRSGEGTTLTESGGDIPNSATVPAGYSGTSRDFERGDLEVLMEDDGGTTDINGADQSISLVAWINPESMADEGWQYVIGKHNHGTDKQYVLSILGTATSKYEILGRISANGDDDIEVISTTTDYSTSAWHHIAMVYNDTDIRIYVDGYLHSTPTAHTTGIFNGGDAFGVGSRDADNYTFDGLIDEPAVFDRELSAAEILEIYRNGIDGTKGANN